MADPATQMREYYKILHHLREFKVDRQYPYSFESLENVLPSDKVQLLAADTMPWGKLLHEKFLGFAALSSNDVIIIPTIPRDYFPIDSVEIKVSTTFDLDPSKVLLGFNDSLNVDLPLLQVSGAGTLTLGEPSVITFKINEQSMDPQSQLLSGVRSLSIHADQADGIAILDIVFRTKGSVCTLEDLEDGLIDGENYVTDGLQTDTIPESLIKYKYMAAAALIWLGKWEHQGHVMGDGKQVNKNYADRLLSIVDRAIDTYINPPDSSTDDESDINEDLIGSSYI